jgi:hypothetical protein
VLATHFGSKMVNQEAIQATAKRENALMRNKQP